MWDLRLRCILVVLAATTLFPSAVFAQDVDRDRDLKELQAKLYFLRRLVDKYPVSGFAETWQHLEEDAKKGRRAYPDDPPFDTVHRDVLLSWGESLMVRDRVDDALVHFETIANEHRYDKADPGFRKATSTAAEIHATKADGTTEDDLKLTHLVRARELYVLIGEQKQGSGFTDRIVDLKCKNGLRLYDQRDFAGALEEFQKIQREEKTLGAGRAATALQTINEKTEDLNVEFIDVTQPGVEVRDVGRLILTPRGAGERREISLGDLGDEKKFRWFTGDYDVGLVLPGGEKPVLTERASIGKGAATVRFPGRFPHGMIYVPAGGKVSRPFFIDRTEVTEDAYRKFDSGYVQPTRVPGDHLPAHGISFESAKKYAASVGKKLPSPEQWDRAAFGDDKGKYPWGSGPPSAFCHIGGKAGPIAVDSHPDGASPWGVLNMAGNVWEWLDTGYVIGAGYRSPGLSATIKVPGEKSWVADFLRNPKPGPEVYRTFREQRTYRGYQVIDKKNSQEVGIRCVIEL